MRQLSAEEIMMIDLYAPIHNHKNSLAACEFSCGFIDYPLLHPYSPRQRLQLNELFDNRQHILRFSENINNIYRERDGMKICIAGFPRISF